MTDDLIAKLRAIRVPTKEEVLARKISPTSLEYFGIDVERNIKRYQVTSAPLHKDLGKIFDMPVLTHGWIVPWALNFTKSGEIYLNDRYRVSRGYWGTSKICIERYGEGKGDFSFATKPGEALSAYLLRERHSDGWNVLISPKNILFNPKMIFSKWKKH